MTTTHQGSCLCGDVSFEVQGEAIRFRHCHCQRCRKSTGTGHASNLLVNSEGIDWIKGADNQGAYTVPESEHFTRHFCTTCGSPLPSEITSMGAVLIPAGLLETEPVMQPQSRIFQNSRASWSCYGDGLPCFDEYPD